MEEWLHTCAEYVALTIEAVAILAIAFGSAEAFVQIVRMLVTGQAPSEKRPVWMRFALWLTAGLTFQLAADVVSTAIAPNWEQIGHVAAIAAIRTFLSYFLDRDIEARRTAILAEHS